MCSKRLVSDDERRHVYISSCTPRLLLLLLSIMQVMMVMALMRMMMMMMMSEE